MTCLHFIDDEENATCQHVQARDRTDIIGYFSYVHKRGETHGYDLNALRKGYADWAGTSRIAAKEASTLLKNFDLIDQTHKISEKGTIAARMYDQNRTDIVHELFTIHFRVVSTLAYTLDILWRSTDPVDHSALFSRIMNYAPTESTIEENSIRNALNLLSGFDAVAQENEGWVIRQNDLPSHEAVIYAIYILSVDNGVLGSQTLRNKLPNVVNATEDGTERTLRHVRQETSLYDIRTTGDRARTTPFAGIFEIDARETDLATIQEYLF